MNNGSRICLGGGDANRHSIGDYIVSGENILSAWNEFKKGKRKKSDIQRFEFFLEENIWKMHDELTEKVYRHNSYTPFYITDPKLRHIHKATVRDRLLHQAVFRVLYPIFDKIFIYDSYSCRINKGTHRAVNRLDNFLRKASHNYHAPIYALKCDISRFFDSVDQAILKGLIKRRVNEGTVNEILDIIINSFESKTRKGIPLGNVTSQLFANVYLHELDRFCKHTLNIKYYLRYCDDFIILGPSREHLKEYISLIQTFLINHLNLTLHPRKIIIRKLSQGIDFLGYVIFEHHRVLRRKTAKRMLRKMATYQYLKEEDEEKYNQVYNSYLGLLKHCSGYKLKNFLNFIFLLIPIFFKLQSVTYSI